MTSLTAAQTPNMPPNKAIPPPWTLAATVGYKRLILCGILFLCLPVVRPHCYSDCELLGCSAHAQYLTLKKWRPTVMQLCSNFKSRVGLAKVSSAVNIRSSNLKPHNAPGRHSSSVFYRPSVFRVCQQRRAFFCCDVVVSYFLQIIDIRCNVQVNASYCKSCACE